MNALIISDNPQVLDEVQKSVAGIDSISVLSAFRGSLASQQNLPVKGEVDLLILDCTADGAAELGQLERLAPLHPRLQTILVAPANSSELLMHALRIGVREVLTPPLRKEDMVAALRRISQRGAGGPRAQGKVASFISCKGGSGATFLATNLGYVLAAHQHKKVLLIDMNLQFGDAALYVSDRRPPQTLADLSREIQRVDAAFLQSSAVEVLPNYFVIAAPDDPTRAMDVRPAAVDTLVRLARANFDFVIIDLGRSLDAVSVQALDLSDHIYPVLQLTLPFIRDAKRLLDVFRSLDYPAQKVRVIVNRMERVRDLNLHDLEQTLGTKVFATIPNHYESVTASVNQGVPIQKLSRNSPVTKALQQLSSELVEQEAGSASSWLGRILGRS
ncbi:AAA family ATPase [Quisquiliibacterium transsilvanicum]|uniref:Pilus assembly protein CpaE n=1 Tax=Quisquiliibacterium transsilvanicum TaxID=1549638 RepID=A0A7W8HFB3_9BURK|nr:AAA family ATPase [Quisquiliibacterium transsilvanicum]MBB5271054.1 pilus assembly protein CpaE [Quisquiliibacterium transsilvanicum]